MSAKGRPWRRALPVVAMALAAAGPRMACAETGYDLWLRYAPIEERGLASAYQEAQELERRWQTLRGKVDDERHEAVLRKLRQQMADAAAWRDKCLRYFQQWSRGAIPD